MAGKQISIRVDFIVHRKKCIDKWYKRLYNKIFRKYIKYY